MRGHSPAPPQESRRMPQGPEQPTRLIRNFSIVAHIDHGKSTLADQFLLKTGAISQRDFRAQVLDDISHFDSYKGVVVYVRVMAGRVAKGQRIRLMRGGTEHEVVELGQFRPAMTPCASLSAGQVGYLMAQIKMLADVHIGDTVTD